MPRDKDGRWIPEAHRAQDYTPKQTEAAQNLLTNFDRAASGAEPKLPDIRKANALAAATTIQRVLTPTGQTRLALNAPAQARDRDAAKLTERMQAEASRDTYRHWRKKELMKEFDQAKIQDRSKDMDLDR